MSSMHSRVPLSRKRVCVSRRQARSLELAAVAGSGSSKQSRDPPAQRSGRHLRLPALQIDDLGAVRGIGCLCQGHER